jgi:hypothetical protein
MPLESMNIHDILTALKQPFSAGDHKERQLPGGGRWFFLPWQKIRERLDQVCPDWSCTYSHPVVAGDYVVIRCQLTICGITREGVGNDHAYPDKQTYGTPIERATADAFKSAAEQFGVGAYLDNQQFVIKHLQSQGDGRGVQFGLRDKASDLSASSAAPSRSRPPQQPYGQPQRSA